jgi:hypothetical protein
MFGGAHHVNERTWGDDREWVLSASKESLPQFGYFKPLYVIAPIDPANPQAVGHDGLGGHDHVAPVRMGTAGLSVVFRIPGPKAGPMNVGTRFVCAPNGRIELLYAADLDRDGDLENLTSVDKVEEAIARGLATPAELDFAFMTALVPARNSR